MSVIHADVALGKRKAGDGTAHKPLGLHSSLKKPRRVGVAYAKLLTNADSADAKHWNLRCVTVSWCRP